MSTLTDGRPEPTPETLAMIAARALTGDTFSPTTNLQSALWLTALRGQTDLDRAPGGLVDSLIDAAGDARARLDPVDQAAFFALREVVLTIRNGARWMLRRP